MKNLIYCLFILGNLFRVSNYAQSFVDSLFNIDEFNKLEDNGSKYSLIDKIIPIVKYDYWECYEVPDNLSNKSLKVYNGDRKFSDSLKDIKVKSGFFYDCHFWPCYSYIVAVKNGKVIVIDNDEKLKKFIGKIDNVEEALIIARLHNLYFDSKNKLGGAYKKIGNKFYLYLLDYSTTPVTYKSVRAIISDDSKLKIIDEKIYYQSDEWIEE